MHTIKSPVLYLLLVAAMVLLHLLVYPLWVGGLSKAFYEHSFAYMPTFNYSITAYLVKSVIIYGFSMVMFFFLKKDTYKAPPSKIIETETIAEPSVYINSITVSDGNNKKIILPVKDIYCISASTPYVYIHYCGKKYLHTGTLKLLETRLNNNLFVRIHKSGIVNVSKVVNYQSRHNGDYDITLDNNNQLRVSRMYAKNFKHKLEESHRMR